MIEFDSASTQTTLETELTLYAEDYGSIFDDSVLVGVFGSDGTDWSLLDYGEFDISSVQYVEASNGLTRAVSSYVFTFSFGALDYERFMLVYQRCCRPSDISNTIEETEITGVAIKTEFTHQALRTQNYSPTLEKLPWTTDIISSPIYNDMSWSDVDEDSLSYQFSKVRVSGGYDPDLESGLPNDECHLLAPSPLKCIPPFSQFDYNIDSQNSDLPFGQHVSIDENTGIISGELTEPGIYLYGIKVKEYRNGILLSETLLDYIYDNEFVSSAFGLDESNLAIYPNPVSNTLHIEGGQIESVELYDINGKSMELSFISNQLDVSNIESGMYLLKIYNHNSYITYKVLIR